MLQSVTTAAPPVQEPEEMIQQARNALEAGHLDEAECLFRSLLGGAWAADAQKGIGDLSLRQGKLSKAAEAYRAALNGHPGWPEAENNLGSVYKLQGEREAAEHHYLKALAASPLLSSANNNLGVLLAEKGELEEAVARFRNALCGSPAVREARRNLATALFQLGRFDEARAEFERALDENSEDPDTLVGMAKALRASGKPQDALGMTRRALQLRSVFAEAYIEAGLAALELGEIEQALSYCRNAVESAPNNAAAHEALGAALVGCGAPQDAEHHFRRALVLIPNLPSVLVKLGRLQEERGHIGDAEKNYRTALAADAENALAITHLGNLALKRKRPAEALAHFERARQLQPASAAAHGNIATALNELGRHQEAAKACQKAIALDPSLAEPHHNLGAILQTLGRLGEARVCYERALQLKPDMVPALFSLLNLAPDAADWRVKAMIETLLGSDKLPEDARLQLHFAQVRLYEKGGDHDAAFAAAVAGQAIEARRKSYDAAQFERLAAGIVETFNAEFFANRRSYGAMAERPIFVIGMPRSGTTLLEQVLASHPQVFGGGELPFLPNLAADLRRWGRTERAFPHGVAELREPEVLRLAGAYRRATRNLVGSAGRRVIDKMTSNLFYLGLAALLFPRAKIVYCRRDPFDLFISSYFMLFRNPIPYTNEQATFAHFYLLQENLFSHWCRELPLEIHVVEYEDFVTSQEARTRALLQYCELDWDPRCLDFHLTERPIRTSSDTQVRRPLYRTSVGRAAPYRKHLGELEAALGRC